MSAQNYNISFLVEMQGKEGIQAVRDYLAQIAENAKTSTKDIIELRTEIVKAYTSAGLSSSQFLSAMKAETNERKQQIKDLNDYQQAQEKAATAARKAAEEEAAGIRRRNEELQRIEQRAQLNRVQQGYEQRGADAAFMGSMGSGSNNLLQQIEQRAQLNRLQQRYEQEAADAAFIASMNRSRGGGIFNRLFGGGGSNGEGASLLGRVGGRVAGAELGGLAGIPGSGFIGSQVSQGLGISGGAAIGLAGAAAGIYAGVELAKHISDLAKWAQEQSNLSKELGVTTDQMQRLSRISEISGVNLEGVAKSVGKLSTELFAGGSRGKQIQSALGQLGLSQGVAFEDPATAIQKIAHALAGIADQATRLQLAKELLGDVGASLAGISDRFDDLSKKTHIIDIDELVKAREDLKSFGEIFDVLLSKVANPIIVQVQFARANTTGVISGLGALESGFLTGGPLGNLIFGPDSTPAPSGPYGPPTPENLKPENIAAANLQAYRTATGKTGTPEEKYQNTKSDIAIQRQQFQDKLKSGRERVSPQEIQSTLSGFSRREEAAEKQRKDDEQALTAPERFKDVQRETAAQQASRNSNPTLSQQIGAEFKKLQDDFDVLYDKYPPSFRPKLDAELAKRQNVIVGRYTDEFNKNIRLIQDEGAPKLNEQGIQFGNTFITNEELAGARQQLFVGKGELNPEIFGAPNSTIAPAAGYVSPQRQIRDVQSSLQRQLGLYGAQANLAGTNQGTQANDIYALRKSAADDELKIELKRIQAIGDAGKAQEERDEAEDQHKQKLFEAQSERDEKLLQIANQVKNQFAEGFASVILGAQNSRSGTGVLNAIRGFGEQQEATILHNIGGIIWGNIHPTAGAKKPKFSLPDILNGTIFQPSGAHGTALDQATETHIANTDEWLRKIYELLDKNNDNGTGIFIPGIGNVPIPPSLSGGASTSSLLAGLPGIGGIIAGIATGNGAGSSGLGTFASFGFPGASGSGGRGGIGLPISNPLSVLFGGAEAKNAQGVGLPGVADLGSGTLSPTTGQKIGSAAEVGAAAAGVAIGALTVAHGGARNVLGGAGAILGSIGALLGPTPAGIALDVAGLATTFVSSLLGDPKTIRAQNINRQLFTSQYNAPPAQNVTESGNGGYADVDAFGNVRTSTLSPYPIVANPYLDNPHRIVVPGRTISTYGGYSNQVGAILPVGGIPPVQIHIHAMDTENVVSHASDILDAIHVGLTQGYHPVQRTLQGLTRGGN